MAEKTNKRSASAVTVALLVLACCRLALAFSTLSPSSSSSLTRDDDDDPAARRVEPVGYLASVASSVLAAYVAASAAAARHGWRRRLSAGALLAEARRTWARPAATALYIELLTAAMASLLLTLGAFLGAIGGCGSAAAGILAASGSVALVGWLGPVLFAHSDIACRMSLVVAAVEEGCEGAAAVRRAEALVAGRRARGFAFGLVAGAIEQAPAWLCGDGASALVLEPAVLAAKIAACCVCAAFYYDCRRRHDGISGSSRGKFEEMAKCCQNQMDGSDMGDESEVEEFGSAFDCFRLT
ncbi:hypothetical protein BAE44_0024898 [Dichanthelium oligosanthes]|uniref:Uncharacterized protein n=1 Tax=Dichanthelium oligosanthes TaxID=888268 RepID=A0A1E5UMH7_9POAL|nr:hypothetical protein BAE44_0024898 [Dichanthelium oligosanthes]